MLLLYPGELYRLLGASNFSMPRFSIRRKKNLQKLNVFFLDQNRRNYRLYGMFVECCDSEEILYISESYSFDFQ
jgi:hypothetical protein